MGLAQVQEAVLVAGAELERLEGMGLNISVAALKLQPSLQKKEESRGGRKNPESGGWGATDDL